MGKVSAWKLAQRYQEDGVVGWVRQRGNAAIEKLINTVSNPVLSAVHLEVISHIFFFSLILNGRMLQVDEE